MLRGRCPYRTLLILSAIAVFLSFLILSTHRIFPSPHEGTATTYATNDKSYFPPAPETCDDGTHHEDFCSNFPRELLDDIQIVVKTGIGERHRLRALLSSYCSCISNILIVSDVNDVFEGQQIHDVLADLPVSYARHNNDWAVYEEQHRALAAGESIDRSHEGWKLDRFKFLPMVEYAYARNSAAKWYVFIETDTYLFWDSLFRVLKKLDPTQHHYLGTSIVGAYDRWFAYGGSGLVLSQALLRDLPLMGDQRLSVKYEAMTREECCGDTVLAYALFAEVGLRLENMFPTFSGDEPQWAWVSSENWCKPLVSLHHLSAETMNALWRWERCRRTSHPEKTITFSMLLDWGLTPLIANGTARISHWNNGANNASSTLKASRNTAEGCFEACKEDQGCLQASYAPGHCRFAKRLRPGQAVEEDIVSYWDITKLRQMGWRPQEGFSAASCPEVDWPEPQTMVPAPDFVEWLVGNCFGVNPTSRGCLRPNRRPP